MNRYNVGDCVRIPNQYEYYEVVSFLEEGNTYIYECNNTQGNTFHFTEDDLINCPDTNEERLIELTLYVKHTYKKMRSK